MISAVSRSGALCACSVLLSFSHSDGRPVQVSKPQTATNDRHTGDSTARDQAPMASPELRLHAAVGDGDLELIDRLLKRGADPNSRDDRDGETPIFRAKDVKSAELLKAYGARLDVINKRGETPARSITCELDFTSNPQKLKLHRWIRSVNGGTDPSPSVDAKDRPFVRSPIPWLLNVYLRGPHRNPEYFLARQELVLRGHAAVPHIASRTKTACTNAEFECICMVLSAMGGEAKEAVPMLKGTLGDPQPQRVLGASVAVLSIEFGANGRLENATRNLLIRSLQAASKRLDDTKNDPSMYASFSEMLATQLAAEQH